MVTSVLADRHPGELHIFRNYDPPSPRSKSPYATTATFKPLTTPQGTWTLSERWHHVFTLSLHGSKYYYFTQCCMYMSYVRAIWSGNCYVFLLRLRLIYMFIVLANLPEFWTMPLGHWKNRITWIIPCRRVWGGKRLRGKGKQVGAGGKVLWKSHQKEWKEWGTNCE